MRLNNPLPASLGAECEKCARILQYFVDPHQAFSVDKVIPPSVLSRAKGLAIITVIKAGFVGSVRFGSGLIVAREKNTWSAPSAITTGGFGFGGQLGVELTDFVFILNDKAAVSTFADGGSVLLGGNVSVAAGPVGRNAEAAGAASLHNVAGIFSYSRTRGLFAGVSVEGSVIVERRDANEKLYGHRYSAMELLKGNVEPPRQADPLLNVLRSPIFGDGDGGYAGYAGYAGLNPSEYNDEPTQDEGVSRTGTNRASMFAGTNGLDRTFDATPGFRDRADSWRDDLRKAPGGGGAAAGSFARFGEKKTPPPRPTAPKPSMGKKMEAIALYTFDADQDGDLGFAKGDVIEVVKKTDSDESWWTGRIGAREGIFPSNYVKMKE